MAKVNDNFQTGKYNITDFSNRTVFARTQTDKSTAVYYFECADDTSLEQVVFNLAGGAVDSTLIIPKSLFVSTDTTHYFTFEGTSTATYTNREMINNNN